MGEEQQIHFNESDVVWIKYGSLWWPGEVKDKSSVPQNLLENLKKEPLAFVKFFDEEFYRSVENADQIFPYNCGKKNDFIKKGMDAFKTINLRMAKFSKYVSAAEVKTSGTVDILSGPIFSLNWKQNCALETFGSPVQEKLKNVSTEDQLRNAPHISHRRFLGYNDYEAHIIIQYPGKDRIPEEPDVNPALGGYEEPSYKFTCSICNYVTNRFGIFMQHKQYHKVGIFKLSSPPHKMLKNVRKRKKIKLSTEASDMKEENDTPSKKRKT